MASTKVQLEVMDKPNPRYILELHTIREMIQEADNMDKGLKTVLGVRPSASVIPGNGTPAPQPRQPPALATPAPFAPPAPAVVSRPPAAHLQPGHRKKLSQVQAPAAPAPQPPRQLPILDIPAPIAPPSPTASSPGNSPTLSVESMDCD
jgi:hypothetical protein